MKQRRLIGLIGGMSWESTALYYRLLNEGMQARLGAHHNARSILATIDFEEALAAGLQGRWDEVATLLVDAAKRLAAAGADFIVITSNTGHVVAEAVQSHIDRPLLHIADAVAAAVHRAGLRRVGLVGTRMTLEGAFYAARLREQHGLMVELPAESDRATLDRIIIDELSLGAIRPESKQAVVAAAEHLRDAGAQGLILGCTELPLLVGQADFSFPVFDTTRLHVEAVLEHSLQ